MGNNMSTALSSTIKFIIDQKIHAALSDKMSLVLNRNANLTFKRDFLQRQLDSQCLFVDRFKITGTQVFVHLNSRRQCLTGPCIKSFAWLHLGVSIFLHVFPGVPGVLAVHNNSLIAPSTCSTEMPVRH